MNTCDISHKIKDKGEDCLIRKNMGIKMQSFKNRLMLKQISEDNRGMGVIEVMLIIVVLVGLVVIFRTNITSIVNMIFNKLTSKVNTF